MHIRSLNLHRHFFPCVDRTCPPDSENTTMSPRPEPIFHPHVGTQNIPPVHDKLSKWQLWQQQLLPDKSASLRPKARIIHGDFIQHTRKSFPTISAVQRSKTVSEFKLQNSPPSTILSKKKTKIHALNKSAIPNTANRRKRLLAMCFDRLGTG